MLIFYPLTAALTAVTSLLLGVFVYIKNPQNNINRTWGLLSFGIFIWSFSLSFMFIAKDQTTAMFWSKVLSFGTIIVIPTFFHFCLAVSRLEKQKNSLLKIAYYLAILFTIGNFTPMFIKSVSPKYFFSFYPDAGFLYFIFALNYAFFCSYGCYLMIKTSFQETGYKRTRLQYMAIAAAIGFIGAASLIPLWYNIIYPPILSQFVFLYSIIVTYAIIKHRLMDIEIVIKKGVIYSIIIGLFTGIYIGTLFLFGEFIKNLTGGSYALITILTIILMAIGLQPLKDRLQDWIDKVFFRQKYDSKQTLKQLSTTIGNIIELNELLQLTLQTLSSTLQLKNASALIYNNLNKRFETKASIGLAPDLQNLSISTNFALVQALKETKASILLDETLYLLSSQEQNANTKQKNTLLTQEMKKLGSAMAIPLFAKENLIGILNLGEKRSGESFSTEDIDLLAIFSNNLAVAVENARLHTEILATQKQLFQADKLKSLGTIAAGLAHEIKNPLTSIKGFSQLALDRFKEHDEEFFNQFDEIVPRQLDRINQLVERLNQFSKPPELKRSLTQVNKLIDNLLGLFENKCRKQKIEIVKELETLPTLSADPDQLSQVFMNLMLNAIEAMPQGGKLTIKTSLYEKFKVAVEITDTGMGIPEEELPHIFDPFYTTKPEGTGLGLSIVNQIIEEHHASIEVKSIIGEGTAFRLIFRS